MKLNSLLFVVFSLLLFFLLFDTFESKDSSVFVLCGLRSFDLDLISVVVFVIFNCFSSILGFILSLLSTLIKYFFFFIFFFFLIIGLFLADILWSFGVIFKFATLFNSLILELSILISFIFILFLFFFFISLSSSSSSSSSSFSELAKFNFFVTVVLLIDFILLSSSLDKVSLFIVSILFSICGSKLILLASELSTMSLLSSILNPFTGLFISIFITSICLFICLFGSILGIFNFFFFFLLIVLIFFDIILLSLNSS